ncbi:hypothetical protein K440DRAFT_641438 [Wilcoxina mikolae CBS 423.85]|nr:hypothetical protein K440DRAFT_641438 [Wilcoxina mikolae CBS 423.85]
MAVRINRRQLSRLLGEDMNSSPAAPFPMGNGRNFRGASTVNGNTGIHKDGSGYRRKSRLAQRPIPAFKIDESDDPEEPEDVSEYLLGKYGNGPDGIFDLDHCDPNKPKPKPKPIAVTRNPLADITHLINTPGSGKSWDLSWEALDERYNDFVGVSIDMGMRLTPPRRAPRKRSPMQTSLLDEFEAEEKLFKAFNRRHSQIVMDTPIMPSHMQASDMSSPLAQRGGQRYQMSTDTEGDSIIFDVSESSTESEHQPLDLEAVTDGNLPDLPERSFPTGDDTDSGEENPTNDTGAMAVEHESA